MSLFLKPARFMTNHNIFMLCLVAWSSTLVIFTSEVAIMIRPFILFFLFGYFWQEANNREEITGFAPALVIFWISDISHFWFTEIPLYADLLAVVFLTVFCFQRLALLLQEKNYREIPSLRVLLFVFTWLIIVFSFFMTHFVSDANGQGLRLLTYLALWAQSQVLLRKTIINVSANRTKILQLSYKHKLGR